MSSFAQISPIMQRKRSRNLNTRFESDSNQSSISPTSDVTSGEQQSLASISISSDVVSSSANGSISLASSLFSVLSVVLTELRSFPRRFFRVLKNDKAFALGLGLGGFLGLSCFLLWHRQQIRDWWQYLSEVLRAGDADHQGDADHHRRTISSIKDKTCVIAGALTPIGFTSEVITPRPIIPTFGCAKETHPHTCRFVAWGCVVETSLGGVSWRGLVRGGGWTSILFGCCV